MAGRVEAVRVGEVRIAKTERGRAAAAPTAPLREEHKELVPHIEALRTVASGGRYLSDEQVARAQAATGEGTGGALTERELGILRLLAQGKDAQAIADELTISANTVRTHLQNIFSKLGAHSKLEAVATATARGLLRR